MPDFFFWEVFSALFRLKIRHSIVYMKLRMRCCLHKMATHTLRSVFIEDKKMDMNQR